MDLVHISVGQAAITVLLGMSVVFLGLILLMWVVQLMSKIMIRHQASKAEKHAAAEKRKVEETGKNAPADGKAATAPGSAGELKLYNTDPRDAAMIMAIVADATGKPLNELRFKSIREVKEGTAGEIQ
ncbi:MAG: OadG family protein [Oscillospiraceae bacterium]|nr:OadG family protein [Oscillospiraceae bacterium]